MLSKKTLDESLVKLGMLKFFPTTPRVIAEIGKIIRDTSPDDKRTAEVIDRLIKQENEWMGPAALRSALEPEKRPVPFDIKTITG
jgi:hypothetical protein